MTARGHNFGWLSSFAEFSKDDPALVRDALLAFISDASREQVDAWTRSLPFVREGTSRTVARYPASANHSVLLEYELPRENGRRPDAVLLGNGTVLVVEFKGTDTVRRADLDQVAAYARDLRHYHALSHEREVVPALVPLRYEGRRSNYDGVEVVPAAEVGAFIEEISEVRRGEPIDGQRWADAQYAPLPGLVEAARDIFHDRPLPYIKRAQSAGIPEALQYLTNLAHEASRSSARHLVLLTGVPGAGKTLVGLQLVHDRRLDDLRAVVPGRELGSPAVFLSGNGPLVDVLQHALRGPSREEKIFVSPIKSYLKQHLLNKHAQVPSEHIIVFDEAQRAWDPEQIAEKHNVSASEPDLVIRCADRIPEWCVVLGLVGEGQEIHKGEEAGLTQWADAVRQSANSRQWSVHGPAKLAPLFEGLPGAFRTTDALDLTVSLRSHLASDVSRWVSEILREDSDPALLAETAKSIRSAGFTMYFTRHLERAAEYVRARYEGQPDKRYGLVASARAKNLTPLGIDNSFQATKQLRAGPWYNEPPSHPMSGCQLRTVITEFQAQGLELDCPIVCWGDDLYRQEQRWVVAPRKLGKEYRDPRTLRINSYRVLLTRGRDGFIVYVPKDHGDGMDATAAYLEACGVQPLI